MGRRGLAVLAIVAVIVGAGYVAQRLATRCDSEEALRDLVRLLSSGTEGHGLIVFNVHATEGHLPSQCEADTVPIRGNVDLSRKPTGHVGFSVSGDGERRVTLLR
jgi:hypothetical protein